MYLDALGSGHKTEHVISENRVAALSHSVVDAFYILSIDDEDVVSSLLLYDVFTFLSGLGIHLLFLCTLGEFENQVLDFRKATVIK